MRKLIKIALVALGIRAFVRWRKRRRAEAELATPPTTPAMTADPADELRQKLAESREGAEEAATVPEPTVESRRADVHEQGRTTLDDMNASGER